MTIFKGKRFSVFYPGVEKTEKRGCLPHNKSENAGELQVSGRFQKGHSGNPQGKAKGTKNRATQAAEQFLQGELDGICRRLVKEALEGNIHAIKLVLERILPSRKERSIEIGLPNLQTSADALKAMATIVNSVGEGTLTPSEGEAMSKVVDTFVKSLQVHDLEIRLNALEIAMEKQSCLLKDE